MDENINTSVQETKPSARESSRLDAVLTAIEEHPVASICIGVGFVAGLLFGHDIMTHNYTLSFSRNNGLSFSPST